jgi:glycerophosphoryl diester phosphodiesterase
MQPKQPYPLIIAHRGASSFAPENTFAAFRKAIEVGAEGIEFDVRLTKDGIPVVFHDSELNRITKFDGTVSNSTFGELQSFDIGSWFNEKYPTKAVAEFSAETIPTLKQTLNLLKDFDGVIYIELKCTESQIESLSHAVCKLINDSPLLPRIIVKSFELSAIPLIKKLSPELNTGALFAPKMKTIIRKEERLIKISKEFGADYLSLHYSLVTGKLMKKAADEKLPVAIWTVDSPRWIKRSIRLGVAHVITNEPQRLLKKREILIRNASLQV